MSRLLVFLFVYLFAGQTALMIATKDDHPEIAELLRKAGDKVTPEPRFTVIDLGKDMIPKAINKSGTIAGNQGYVGEAIFLWRKGNLQRIKPPGGFGYIEVYGL